MRSEIFSLDLGWWHTQAHAPKKSEQRVTNPIWDLDGWRLKMVEENITGNTVTPNLKHGEKIVLSSMKKINAIL